MRLQNTGTPKRIGFLYNHDELHQVAHTAPIISALQRLSPTTRVEVITSSDNQRTAVLQLLDRELPDPAFWPIEPNGWSRLVEKAAGNLIPLSRINSLMRNTELLGQFDALVVPETTSTFLKTRCLMTKPKLIFFPHGAGDRSIGFSPDIGHFDYVLLPGEKTRGRMLKAGVINTNNHRIVGYPKFEAFAARQPVSLFTDDKPAVLYNPHFDPRLSSWYKFGEKILDFFAEQDDYNLIFAPHVMLFQRRLLASVEHRLLKFRRNLAQRYQNLKHIQIDTGSDRSVDMTYTQNADIYLGDVSSQIYEFIGKPRPAIFLNSHGAEWQSDPNYECWHFGPVLDDLTRLSETLRSVTPLSGYFRNIQMQAFNESFKLIEGKSSAQRAAEAIAELMKLPIGAEEISNVAIETTGAENYPATT
tara:strand:- start:1218 stop:2468 length:1251 start_codon:yes stop_codon:yes gene_type:complete